jgi:hypothetical protein
MPGPLHDFFIIEHHLLNTPKDCGDLTQFPPPHTLHPMACKVPDAKGGRSIRCIRHSSFLDIARWHRIAHDGNEHLLSRSWDGQIALARENPFLDVPTFPSALIRASSCWPSKGLCNGLRVCPCQASSRFVNLLGEAKNVRSHPHGHDVSCMLIGPNLGTRP